MRRSIAVAVALLAVAFVFVGGPSLLVSPPTTDVAPEESERATPEIVRFGDDVSGFWPHLSASEAHEKRSPINLIARGDTDALVRVLGEEDGGDWNETEADHFEADDLVDDVVPGNGTDGNATFEGPSTDVPWSSADGGTRYAYLDPGPDGEPSWTTETLQLEDGEYYGYRYHIRAYESPNPDEEWVAMQTHSEHFDWFTLRHRVDGSQAAQSHVESGLMAVPGIDPQEDVSRVYLGNGGSSDYDGWATEIDLTVFGFLPVLVGLAAGRERVRERVDDAVDSRLHEADRARLAAAAERVEGRHLLLAATLLTIVLGVRALGIALDRHAGFLSAHAIAAVGYPFVAVGIPVATYALASGLERRLDAAVAASVSLAVAIWFDYGLLGVDVLPIDVIVQRMLVVVALGLIAGGAARRATRESRLNDMLVGGVALWVFVLAGTLFGYL